MSDLPLRFRSNRQMTKAMPVNDMANIGMAIHQSPLTKFRNALMDTSARETGQNRAAHRPFFLFYILGRGLAREMSPPLSPLSPVSGKAIKIPSPPTPLPRNGGEGRKRAKPQAANGQPKKNFSAVLRSSHSRSSSERKSSRFCTSSTLAL